MALQNTSIALTVTGGEDKVVGDYTASFPKTQPAFYDQVTLADGTGSGMAQKFGVTALSLTSGASVTLDLTAFAGMYGTVNFSKIKDCIFDNANDGATDILEVGNDGTVTNAWTSPFAGTNARLRVQPGAPARLPSPIVGFAVDATHKNLKIANMGTNTITGSVLMIGEGT